jgi:hypothetical protein
LIKEMGVKDMFKSALIMITTAITAGFVLNMLLDRIVPAAWLAVGLVGLALILAVVFGSNSDRRELEDLEKAS